MVQKSLIIIILAGNSAIHAVSASADQSINILAKETFDIIDHTLTHDMIEMMAMIKTSKYMKFKTIKKTSFAMNESKCTISWNRVNSRDSVYETVFDFNQIEFPESMNTDAKGTLTIIHGGNAEFALSTIAGQFLLEGEGKIKAISFTFDNSGFKQIEVNGEDFTDELSDYFRIQSSKYMAITRTLLTE